MNRKLKKYAEKQLAQYRNEEFLEELKTYRREKIKRHGFSNKKIVSLCVSLSVVLVTLMVTLLCVFLIKPTTTDTNVTPQEPLQIEPKNEEPIKEISPIKYYKGENRKSVYSDLNEINSVLNGFSLVVGDNIEKRIDEEYKEVLYYYLNYTGEDELSTIEVKICVNPDYKMEEAEKEYAQEGIVATQIIQYNEEVRAEDDLFFFTEIGVIKTDHETIVVTAEIIGLEENSNFIELMNEIIKAK